MSARYFNLQMAEMCDAIDLAKFSYHGANVPAASAAG
jgi:hypothetical protein